MFSTIDTAKLHKQSRCLSTGEWIKNVTYTVHTHIYFIYCIREYYLAVTKKVKGVHCRRGPGGNRIKDKGR